MPIAKVKMPDGRIARFNVPEGTTPEQVISFARQNIEQITSEKSFLEELKESILTGSEAFNIKVEQRGRGIQQALLSVAGALGFDVEERENLIAQRQVESQERFEQLPDGLTKTVSGFVGDVAPLAVTAPIMPQNVAGMFAGGAMEGLTRGSEDVLKPQERAAQTGLAGVTGAVGGVALQGAGKVATKGIKAGADKLGAILGKPKQTLQSVFDDLTDGIEYTRAIDKVRETLGDEAARLQTLISGRVDKDGNKIGKGLFDLAKSRGDKAFVDSGALSKFTTSIEKLADEAMDKDAKFFLSSTAKRLSDLAVKGDITVNDLEAIRRTATKTSSDAIGTTKTVAGDVVKSIDDFLILGLKSKQITGDKRAVSLWNKAIRKRREFAVKFEQPKEIAFALGDDTLESVEAKFLGGASPAHAKHADKVYNNVLKALPENQQEQAGFLLRQATVSKMVKQAAARVDEPDTLSANAMANEIKNLRQRNKSLWSKFHKEEKQELLNLERELRTIAGGGAITKTFDFVQKFLQGATRTGIELPRTVKPKHTVDVQDLINLAQTPLKTTNFTPLLGSTSSATAKEELQ